jgi:hypothetical protein
MAGNLRKLRAKRNNCAQTSAADLPDCQTPVCGIPCSEVATASPGMPQLYEVSIIKGMRKKQKGTFVTHGFGTYPAGTLRLRLNPTKITELHED